MTHDYHKIDRDRLWNVIERDLPVLGAAVERMLVRARANSQKVNQNTDRS